MKKICGLFCIFSLFATCALADGDGGNTGVAYIQDSPMMQEIKGRFVGGEGALFTKYRWSWGAVGEIYKAMLDQCHSVESAELKYMGNWFRQNGNVFSLYDLISVCKKAGFQSIDRNYVSNNGKKYECKLPTTKCELYKGCGEINFTGHPDVNASACNVFITALFIKNNEAKVRAASMSGRVGTFVEKVKDGVYRIVDVVLPNDYWKNGDLNYDANTDQKNTKIYEIYTDKDGKHNVKDTGWHTWTADMFFDVSNNKWNGKFDTLQQVRNGSVVGGAINSFIFPNEDVTAWVYSAYNSKRGAPWHALASAVRSLPGGKYDTKKYGTLLSNKYQGVLEQTETEAHINGVMLNGKIANLDWIGHYLFGLNTEEGSLPNGVAEYTAQNVSMWQGTLESSKMQVAWRMGYETVRINKTKRDSFFKKVEIEDMAEDRGTAYKLIRDRAREQYKLQGEIKCIGTCIDHTNSTPGIADIVFCVDEIGNMQEFEVMGFCNLL